MIPATMQKSEARGSHHFQRPVGVGQASSTCENPTRTCAWYVPGMPCENFLHGFKAPPRGPARAPATAPKPSLTLPLPRRPGQRRSAGATSVEPGPLDLQQASSVAGEGVPAPAAGIVRGRSEPVNAVSDRRATASVELPGARTREGGLGRTLPELAAIKSRDTNGLGH